MADRSETDASLDPTQSVLAAMATLQRSGFGPTAWLSTAWFEAMSEVGSELAQFAAERIKEDVKTQHALLHAKSPDEIREIQATFMQTAIDQYTAETGKLVERSNDMLRLLRVDHNSDPV